MSLIRDVPTLSVGHPDDYLAVIAAALGQDRSADIRYAFESRVRNVTVDQLRAIARDMADAPFDITPALAFERALATHVPPAAPLAAAPAKV